VHLQIAWKKDFEGWEPSNNNKNSYKFETMERFMDYIS
jgi:hypothetical protein